MAKRIWTVEEVGDIMEDGVARTPTQAEKEAIIAGWNASEQLTLDERIDTIRGTRNSLLGVTDQYGLSDRTMTSNMTTFRQNLRDIPTTYTTSDELDALLVKDGSNNFSHAVWQIPTD